MSTFPDGYLAATWTAMEDIEPDAGPLTYYPGSHRMPWQFSNDCGIGLDEVRADYNAAYEAKYEPSVQRTIRDNELEPRTFLARKGDVLIWHHNLIHEGSPRSHPSRTRKSIVCHYFARGAFCYHDISGAWAQPTFKRRRWRG